MYVSQFPNQETGIYSRQVNPRQVISEDMINARVRYAENPNDPDRNVLQGPGVVQNVKDKTVGIVNRIAAWFRGDR
jgi:hypothetical protein